MDNAAFNEFVEKIWAEHVLYQINSNWDQFADKMIKDGMVPMEYKGKTIQALKLQSHFLKRGSVSVNMHNNGLMATHPHFHDFFELIYIYRGQIDSEIDGNLVTLKQGDLCLLNINAYHTMPAMDENTMIFNILIEKNLFDNVLLLSCSDNDIIYSFFIDSLYHKNQKNNHMVFSEQKVLGKGYTDIVHSMIVESFLRETNFQKYLEILLSQLLIQLTRMHIVSQVEQSKQELKQTDITHILSYIGAHYKTATIVSTAEHFHYHPNYLMQLIKKYTGKTFSEIRQKHRLAVCKELLKNSTLTLDEVATTAGYVNSSYFYRLFRKETGMTPAEFRKASQCN
ncbi:MAG: AraC family transcriptional regulator [Clostridiales bacterium]|nr:AraC family transcriptional regulator [Clostridiales bacterium]